MIGGKTVLDACVNDMKRRYVHSNIEMVETPLEATSAAVRSGEMCALATLKLVNGGLWEAVKL
jgi:hypothetical protein